MDLFLIWYNRNIFNYGLSIISYTVVGKRKPDGNLKVFLVSILSAPSSGSLLFFAIFPPVVSIFSPHPEVNVGNRFYLDFSEAHFWSP